MAVSLRILVLANAMNTLSGGDKRFIEIFKRFKGKDFSIKVMLTNVGFNICRNENLDVEYQILPIRSENILGPALSNLLRLIISTFLSLCSSKYDVVYSTSEFPNDIIPAMLLKFRNKSAKWVAVTHYLLPPPSMRAGKFFRNLIAFFVQRISISIMKKYADLIITQTRFLMSQLVSLGVPENKVEVGLSGIDTKLIDSVQEHSKSYDACFVARLSPSKGIYDVINIWELVCSKKEDAKLIMVGGGEKAIFNKLRELIKQKGLTGKVEIAGFRKTTDVYKIMKSSKLFLYADTESGWGMAIAEAMCCRCPVIAYDLPVYQEAFGDAILLVPLKDISGFSERIINLLLNEDLQKEIGERSCAIVEKYDWEKIASRELKIIQDHFSTMPTKPFLPKKIEKDA